MMKVATICIFTLVVVLAAQAWSAPVESVSSARAALARQKINAFLNQEAVVKQMTALGMSRAEVDKRLAKLNDAQLEALAAQVDLIRAGGTIQGGQVNTFGPLTCIFRQIGIVLYNIYSLLFCWSDWK